jgi:hypothetical protein
MIKVVRLPGTDSFVVAVGRGRSFHPISGPHANPEKAARALNRTRSLQRDKRNRAR